MRTTAWICAMLCLVSGCASLQPGTSREADVLAYFGSPAAQFSMPDGSRALDFPRAPSGHENWRVTLGPDGIVRRVEQLLDEEHFAQIKRGMLIEEVKRALGRHGEYSAYPALAEEVFSWRYMEFGSRRMFFNAHFDGSGQLKFTSRTEEPIPDSDNSGSP